MSTICITHLAALCNYAPCSDTCCIVRHVNPTGAIRVPYEYTVNWQQIPPFTFQSFRNYRGNHNGLILLFTLSLCPSLSLSLSRSFCLFPSDGAGQIPKQLFLGLYLLKGEKNGIWKGIKGKIKGRSDQGESCGSCLLVLCAHSWIWGRLQSTWRLWEIKEVPCFALHTSNTINNAFSCPTCRVQHPSAGTHTQTHTAKQTHTHTHSGLQHCLILNWNVCWAVREMMGQIDRNLRAS